MEKFSCSANFESALTRESLGREAAGIARRDFGLLSGHDAHFEAWVQFLRVAHQPIKRKPLDFSPQNITNPGIIYAELGCNILLQELMLSQVLGNDLAKLVLGPIYLGSC